MSTDNRIKHKVSDNDGMFSKKNMQDAFGETTEIKARKSKRLEKAGVSKRPIDPNYSSSHKQGTTGQVAPQQERHYFG